MSSDSYYIGRYEGYKKGYLNAKKEYQSQGISYTESDRKAIEDEVWDFARRIICPSDCCEDSISKYTEKFLDIPSYKARAIFKDLSYQEVKAKYEEWLKQKDEIRVGDEVTFEMAFGNGLDNNMKAVALDQATKGEEWCVLTENGCVETHDEEDLYKTGRHFPEVAELLQKMRGNSDENSIQI